MADDDGFAPDPLDAMWPLLELEADVSGDVRTYYEGMSLRAESGLMTPRPDYFEEDFARAERSPHMRAEYWPDSQIRRGAGISAPRAGSGRHYEFFCAPFEASIRST